MTELELIAEAQATIAGLESEDADLQSEISQERTRRAEAEAAQKHAPPAIGDSLTPSEMETLILWMFEKPDAEKQLPRALGMLLLGQFGIDAARRFADFATKKSPRLRNANVPYLMARASQYAELLKRGHSLPPDWRPLMATNKPDVHVNLDTVEAV
jgi:hypothetical protein